MRIVASSIVRNERGRYLDAWIDHLLTFVDEVRLIDDNSDDGTFEWLNDHHAVRVKRNSGPAFYEHEGHARQLLYHYTLEAEPDYVLAIDADEFIGEPINLIKACQRGDPVFTLGLSEVWGADHRNLMIRVDGLWRERRVPILYKPQPGWKIRPRKLACGREPQEVVRIAGHAKPCGSAILHFGWARKSERVERAARYDTHDGGKFHQDRHLQSILWQERGDRRLRLSPIRWPQGLRDIADELVTRINV